MILTTKRLLLRNWREDDAADAMITYAFTNLKTSSIFAGHHPENTASARVLEKLGFGPVGTEFYEPTGLQHPSYRLNQS